MNTPEPTGPGSERVGLDPVPREERLLRWFEYAHLPDHLQQTSRPFAELAFSLVASTKPGPERSVALRKLLEAKDAAVRATLHPGG